MGGRLPIPVVGPGWQIAKVASEVLGAPLPDHVRELLVRGRCADATLAAQTLDLKPRFSTLEVVKDLYEWASVTYLDPAELGAA
jgi:nucleoside-diphosphate-sugar epimerase